MIGPVRVLAFGSKPHAVLAGTRSRDDGVAYPG